VAFAESVAQLEGLEIQVHPESDTTQLAVIRLHEGRAAVVSGQVEAVFGEFLEITVKMTEDIKGIRLSFWQNGLPIRLIPQAGSFGTR